MGSEAGLLLGSRAPLVFLGGTATAQLLGTSWFSFLFSGWSIGWFIFRFGAAKNSPFFCKPIPIKGCEVPNFWFSLVEFPW